MQALLVVLIFAVSACVFRLEWLWPSLRLTDNGRNYSYLFALTLAALGFALWWTLPSNMDKLLIAAAVFCSGLGVFLWMTKRPPDNQKLNRDWTCVHGLLSGILYFTAGSLMLLLFIG